MSKIEELILSQDFGYLQPWFYNHQYALRCELAKPAKSTKKRVKSAYKNAIDIYKIIFPNQIDAVFFTYIVGDYPFGFHNTDNYLKELQKEFEWTKSYEWNIKSIVKGFKNEINFFYKYQNKYRNIVVTDLEHYDDDENYILRKNRVICYIDNKKFNYKKLIKRCVLTDFGSVKGGGKETYDTSFVSFENECILSIYDDRGCDIVFATKEKYQEFYQKLQKYLLEYDVEEMQRRYNN